MRKCPSIVKALVAAAKRVRQSKHEAVAGLLSEWRKIFRVGMEQEHDHVQPRGTQKRANAEVTSTFTPLPALRVDADTSFSMAKKQRKITSFLGGSTGLATAGG